MTSKDTIINKIRNNLPNQKTKLPDTNIKHMKYEDKNEKFANSLKSVGGNAIWLQNESIDEFVQKSYTDASVIVSTCKDISCATLDINSIKDPHELKDVDLAIIEGEFGVAENGAIWVVNPNDIPRALYFIAKQLLIIVKKDNIVDTMHEAYEKIEFNEAGYGTFISGPSKTADIEQSLVIGAHGPTDACVLFV
ncbi:lactate utilization protein C [Sulfurospirillum sp. 1307]